MKKKSTAQPGCELPFFFFEGGGEGPTHLPCAFVVLVDCSLKQATKMLAETKQKKRVGTGCQKGKMLRRTMLAPSSSDDDGDIFDEFES